MLQLRQEAEEAHSETVRIKNDISKRLEQEEQQRYQKAMQAEQEELRAKQLELEALTTSLAQQQ
jgi:hypothetical protein